MNFPTLDQAINAARELMEADDAIGSVEIQFETKTGLRFTATWCGIIRNVQRVK